MNGPGKGPWTFVAVLWPEGTVGGFVLDVNEKVMNDGRISPDGLVTSAITNQFTFLRRWHRQESS